MRFKKTNFLATGQIAFSGCAVFKFCLNKTDGTLLSQFSCEGFGLGLMKKGPNSIMQNSDPRIINNQFPFPKLAHAHDTMLFIVFCSLCKTKYHGGLNTVSFVSKVSAANIGNSQNLMAQMRFKKQTFLPRDKWFFLTFPACF